MGTGGVISVTVLTDTPTRCSDGDHPYVHIFALTEPYFTERSGRESSVFPVRSCLRGVEQYARL